MMQYSNYFSDQHKITIKQVYFPDIVQSWMTIKKTEISGQHEFLKPVS